jgi:hypothetical protein
MALEVEILTESKFNVIDQIKENQTLEFERIANWIIAGSGNFEKTHDDGRYRDNCNTFRGASACKDHVYKSLTLHYNHCNKMDCETCFIQASSTRARELNGKLKELREKALKEGVKIGMVKHIALSPTKELMKEILTDYNKFLKFRREFDVKTILEESGLFGGVLMLDLWTKQCRTCGKKDYECSCEIKDLKRVLSPHFHYIGYGYMLHANDFREKFKDWVYVNFGSREDAYHTLFYALTHCALWRKDDGKLKPAYETTGFLNSKHLEPIHTVTKYIPHKCKVCKKPTRRIKRGLVRTGGRFPHTIHVQLIDHELELGREIRYKTLVRSYRIKNIEELREVVEINKIRYEKYKRKKMKTESIEKAGNGDG